MFLYNHNEYVITDLNIDDVDDEMIIFNSNSNVIMSLNNTATTIFRFLKDNNGEKLEIKDIVKHQMEVYSVTADQKENIYFDTVEVIEKMINMNILVCINKDIRI